MNLPSLYASIINQIGDGTGMADTVLHIHAGMAVLFLARVVTRRSLTTPLPLLVVLAAAVANEVMDRLQYGSWRPADSLADMANTLFWPTVLFLGLRWRRARAVR